MSFIQEFKNFAIKGNAVDMAVGIVIGAAFGSIVKSLVDDVIMPAVGLLLGGVDFSNFFLVLKSSGDSVPATLEAAKAMGAVTINYGLFLNAIISFLIVSLAIFIVIKQMNRLQSPPPAAEPTTKSCPECCSTIALDAKRCPHCTSKLDV